MYTWELYGLDGTRLGEIPGDATWAWTRNKMAVASTTIPNPAVNRRAIDIDERDGDVLCVVFLDSYVMFAGELTMAVETGPGYQIILDRNNLVNRMYALPAVDIQRSDDATSQLAHGLFEEIGAPDFTNSPFRKAWTDLNVSLRKDPKRTISMTAVNDQVQPTLVCNFADALWRLSKRLTAKGEAVTYGEPTPITRGALIEALIIEANGGSFVPELAGQDTGIRLGTITAGYDVTPGEWSYKPLSEGLTALIDTPTVPFETPGSYNLNTNFNALTNGNLTGQAYDGAFGDPWLTPSPIGTWATRGFTVQAASPSGKEIVRGAATADTAAWDGAHIVSPFGIGPEGFNSSEFLGEMAFRGTDLVAGQDQYIGWYAYHQGEIGATVVGCEVIAVVQLTTTATLCLVYRPHGGSWTVHSTVALPWFVVNTMTRIRLGIDDTGNVIVWAYNPVIYPGGTPPALTANLSSLDRTTWDASPRYGGKFLYARNSNVYGNVAVDDVWTANPAIGFVAQGIDFELAPTVPTPDTNQDGVQGAGVQIATLNCPTRLGTDKPNAKFRRGGGASERNNPRYYYDYVVGDTVPILLQSGSTTRLDATARVEGIKVERTKGAVTEQPVLEPEL